MVVGYQIYSNLMVALRSNKPQESLHEVYQLQSDAAERENLEELNQLLENCLTRLADNPKAAETYLQIAYCYRKLKNHGAAIAILADGIKHCEFYSLLRVTYINLLAQCNRTSEAIVAAREASFKFPEDILFKLKEATLLPVLYKSTKEMDYFRLRFTEELLRLSGDLRLDTPSEKRAALRAIANHVNVLLGCQSHNDRLLQVHYSEMVYRIMAANYPQWTIPRPVSAVPLNGPLRIGYISSRFRNLSATKYFLGWIREHNKESFSIHAYHVGEKTDATTKEVRRASPHFRQLSGSLEEACRAILADQLQVLVFWDIGVEPVMTQLASLRLAPIQCAAWDQPITTGLPTIDYFFSSDLAEPADAKDHYSETLVKLPGTGTSYQKPVIPKALLNKTRGDFRIREDGIVYLCCQYSYKYLPDQDECFVQLAKRVPNSQFVFLTPNEFVARDFRERLFNAFSNVGLHADDHCVFLPEVERFTYWNLCLLGDAVLDTIGWSGGVSTFEAIACHQPIVTLPGELMRGRQSYAILRHLGVTDTVARDKEDYVAIAARLGLDKQWRDSIVERMIANHASLYSDTRCVLALEEFYRRTLEERQAAV